jgi:hypothetical protein
MWWKFYVLMHESGATRPIETILRRGEDKEKNGWSESNTNIL